jgi:hypothetical protein
VVVAVARWRWVALLLLKITMPDVMPPTTAQAARRWLAMMTTLRWYL